MHTIQTKASSTEVMTQYDDAQLLLVIKGFAEEVNQLATSTLRRRERNSLASAIVRQSGGKRRITFVPLAPVNIL